MSCLASPSCLCLLPPQPTVRYRPQTCLPGGRQERNHIPAPSFQRTLSPYFPWISQGKKTHRGPSFPAHTGHSQIPEQASGLLQALGLPEGLQWDCGSFPGPRLLRITEPDVPDTKSGLWGDPPPGNSMVCCIPYWSFKQWKPYTRLVSDVQVG